MLDLLVEAGADVNAHCPLSDPFVTDMACTPLVAAINLISQDPKDAAVLEPIVLRLIELGADLDARTHRQQRPLDLASLLPTLTVFKALIAKGADPSPVAFVAFEQSVGREEQLGGCHYLEIAVERDRVDVRCRGRETEEGALHGPIFDSPARHVHPSRKLKMHRLPA